MVKEEFTSLQASEKRRVTPSIRKKERSQEELIDQPRRSKRRQKHSDSTSIPATPAPVSSIRDSARNSSTSGSNGRRKRTGSTYNLKEVLSKIAPASRREYIGSTCNLEEELSKRAPSSPERGPVNATDEKKEDQTASNDSYANITATQF